MSSDASQPPQSSAAPQQPNRMPQQQHQQQQQQAPARSNVFGSVLSAISGLIRRNGRRSRHLQDSAHDLGTQAPPQNASKPSNRSSQLRLQQQQRSQSRTADDDPQLAAEPGDVKAARVVLAMAATLPLKLRQEFLVAAAQLPEIAAVFEWDDGETTRPQVEVAAEVLQSLRDRLAPLKDRLSARSQTDTRSPVEDTAAAPRQGPAADVPLEPTPPLPPQPPAPATEPTPAEPVQPPASAAAELSSPCAEEEAQPAAVEPPGGLVPPAAPLMAGGGEAAVAAADGPRAGAADALTVSVVPEYEQYRVSAGEDVRAVVSIKATADIPDRARVCLSCVLDRSGSMSGRIALVQQTAHFLIEQLTPDDCLGLASYDGAVREDVPLLFMTAQARALAHRVVGAMRAGGSTALYDGLVAGVRQQMEAERELAGEGARVVHSCFLFTDGQATDGPREPPEIISGLQAVQAPSGQHVTVHTFGFGAGHSVDLLRRVAEAQAGVYYYISCNDDIAGGFGDALGGLLAVVAKDIQVTVRPAPGVTLTAFRSGGRVLPSSSSSFAATLTTSSSLHRRPASTIAAAATAAAPPVPSAVAFNDMFAEESRECLLALTLPAAAAAPAPLPAPLPGQDSPPTSQPDGAQPQPQPQPEQHHVLADVDLRYTDVASGQRVQRTAMLRVLRSAADRPAGQLPAELVFVTAARFETLDAIEEAQRLAAEGDGRDVSGAHGVLERHEERLRTAPVQGAQVQALAAQTRAARVSIKPKCESAQSDVAAMAGAVQALRQQRIATSTQASVACQDAYDFKCKQAFRDRATKAVKLAMSNKMQ